MKTPKKPKQQVDLAHIAHIALEDKKAQDIVLISLKGRSNMADALVIATGTSRPHVLALADHVSTQIKQHGGKVLGIEGEALGEWVLVDGGDVIVHIFQKEARDHYRLEKLWAYDLGTEPQTTPQKTPQETFDLTGN